MTEIHHWYVNNSGYGHLSANVLHLPLAVTNHERKCVGEAIVRVADDVS